MISIIKDNVEDTKCVLREILFVNLDYLMDSTLALGNLNIYYRTRSK